MKQKETLLRLKNAFENVMNPTDPDARAALEKSLNDNTLPPASGSRLRNNCGS